MSDVLTGPGSGPGSGSGPARTPEAPGAPGYHPRRTLPLRVEAMRQLRRRRTVLMGGVLAALPFILIVAFAIGGTPGSGGRSGATGST